MGEIRGSLLEIKRLSVQAGRVREGQTRRDDVDGGSGRRREARSTPRVRPNQTRVNYDRSSREYGPGW